VAVASCFYSNSCSDAVAQDAGSGRRADHIEEVVYTLSPAFLGAIGESYENARQTVDWFHLVQLFTTAADEVREAEN